MMRMSFRCVAPLLMGGREEESLGRGGEGESVDFCIVFLNRKMDF